MTTKVIRISADAERRFRRKAKAQNLTLRQYLDHVAKSDTSTANELLERIQDMLDVDEIERETKQPGFGWMTEAELKKAGVGRTKRSKGS